MLTDVQMRGAVSVYLGTRQELCTPHVGEEVHGGARGKRFVVDDAGQAVLSLPLPEAASFKPRHDAILEALAAAARWSGVSFTKECYGEFYHRFRPEDRERYLAKRVADLLAAGKHPDLAKERTQVLVPDGHIGESAHGALQGFVELKTLSPGITWYEHSKFGSKPVESRAAVVERDYFKELVAVEGSDGPAARYLRSQGGVKPMVVGQFGEVSPAVDTFLRDCAAARVAPGLSREMAAKLFPSAYSAAVGVLRVKLAVVIARGLPNRLKAACVFAGPAGKEAARRRGQREADRRAKEAECVDFHRLVCENAGVAAGLQRPIPRLVQ